MQSDEQKLGPRFEPMSPWAKLGCSSTCQLAFHLNHWVTAGPLALCWDLKCAATGCVWGRNCSRTEKGMEAPTRVLQLASSLYFSPDCPQPPSLCSSMEVGLLLVTLKRRQTIHITYWHLTQKEDFLLFSRGQSSSRQLEFYSWRSFLLSLSSQALYGLES